MASGCPSGRPDGMPKVYPCKVIVKNGIEAVSDAQIVLDSEPSIPNIMISGMTDASGVAEISTILGIYMQKGAPEGTFTVTILKSTPMVHTKTQEEQAQMTPPEADAYYKKVQADTAKMPKLVPEKLANPDQSPLKIEITNKGGNLDVNLAEYK